MSRARPKYRLLRPLATGARYGALTAVRQVAQFGCRTVWRFRCACGAELDRYGNQVRRKWYHGGRPSCVRCAP